MSSPDYFSKFPNIDYTVYMNKAGVKENISIKDYFHLLRVKDGIFKFDTLYEPYYVSNGERPDQISYNEYKDEQYYWILLQINDIVDYYNQWPLSMVEMDEYISKKYGPSADDIHHYETRTITDKDGNIVLQGRGTPGPDRGGIGRSGLTVSSDFEFTYKDGGTYKTVKGPDGVSPSCIGITNRQYEYDLNEDKSQIYILNKRYIKDYVRDIDRYVSDIEKLQSELSISDT